MLRLALMRDLLERQCLQYELAGSEARGKGPIIVCLNKSDSMAGQRDTFAVAAALALFDIARSERRAFGVVSFDSRVRHEVLVGSGEALPEAVLTLPCSGGTDIAAAIQRGLELVESVGMFKKADLVLITDGESSTVRAVELRERARTIGVSVLGLGIGVSPSALEPWCDDAQVVRSLEALGDQVAGTLGTL